MDKRITLLPPSDASDPTASALVIGDALLRNALVPLFETVWERATPLGGSGGPLPEPQKELLGLLAAGLKDEAIARRLGIHVHTARRRISVLLDSLGAQTRSRRGRRRRCGGGWRCERRARASRARGAAAMIGGAVAAVARASCARGTTAVIGGAEAALA
ncbi:hypothetical protein OG195_14540 [Streptomyces sp. NBC_01362]|uniref:hypothetical protein n=1 Tax=Streptomyces sp. NBC_01362 TaxID=2903839 RepID=UPI002E37B404|nr:hypothetical protein [Streptomyces sp. NBC_01362]